MLRVKQWSFQKLACSDWYGVTSEAAAQDEQGRQEKKKGICLATKPLSIVSETIDQA
jgi:hypothetical protein